MTEQQAPRKLLVFGDCELDLQMRMLWRGGLLQPVEPRVFDVLALLISNRDRVVTREELNTRVWSGVQLTPSAMHRALTVLRQVIGADASPVPMVRTMHRVGYQFVAPVFERLHPAAVQRVASAAPEAAQRTGLSVGLLWRDAVTPQDQLRATKSQLAAALADAMRRLTGQAATVSFVDAPPGPGLPAAAVDWTAGFDAVATVELHADANGCWLEWWVHCSGRRPGRSSLRGPAAQVLLEPAAAGMAAALAGDEAAQPDAQFEDEFSARLCARATALLGAQEYLAAERLFDLLAVAHPGHRSAVVGKLLAMVPQRSHHAAAYAREQLALAEAAGDPQWQWAARYGLLVTQRSAGQAGPDPELAAMALKALDAVASDPRPLPELEVRLICATAIDVALRAPLDHQASVMLKRAAEIANCSGDALRASSAMGLMSGLALLRDDIPLALAYGHDALRLLGDKPAPFSRLYVVGTLALLKMHQGEVAAATELLDGGLQQFAGAESPAISAYTVSGMALAALEVGDVKRIRLMLALLDGFQPPLDPQHAARLATQASLALAEGRAADARSLLRQVVDHPSLQSELGTRAAWLLVLLRLELGQPGAGDAALCLQQLRPLAGGAPSPLLEAWSRRHQAAACRNRGDSGGALAELMDALAVAPGGMVQSLCRLDAAWLLCERGEADRGQLLWSAAGPWATEHPIGLAVKARLLAQQGAGAEAVAWQAKALSAWRGARPALQASMLDAYTQLKPGAGQALPNLGCFASDAWW